MAKNSVRDYSATNSSNTDIQSIDISEGCSPAGINNAVREIMVDLKNVSTGAVALETPSADQLNVDNLRLDGNTISSTDTNGDITIDPDGTGDTIVASGNLNISTVGAIGIADGDNLYIASDDTNDVGLKFNGDGNRIQPCDASGASRDNAIDLGEAGSSRFKDLYLSSQAITSNTGTAGAPNFAISSGALGNNGMFCPAANTIAFSNAGTERMRIDSAGSIIFGSSSTSAPSLYYTPDGSGGFLTKDANTTGATTAYDFKINGTRVGSITTSGSATTYATSSDHRLKENVTATWDATTRLKQLNPVRFNFIADADTTVDGFLAHEAAVVCPESVTGTHNEVEVWKDGEELPDGVSVGDNKLDDDGNTIPVMQGIDQAKIVPLLTKALIESVAKIEALEARITALEAE